MPKIKKRGSADYRLIGPDGQAHGGRFFSYGQAYRFWIENYATLGF